MIGPRTAPATLAAMNDCLQMTSCAMFKLNFCWKLSYPPPTPTTSNGRIYRVCCRKWLVFMWCRDVCTHTHTLASTLHCQCEQKHLYYIHFCQRFFLFINLVLFAIWRHESESALVYVIACCFFSAKSFTESSLIFLSIGSLRNFNEIWIKTRTLSFKNMH